MRNLRYSALALVKMEESLGIPLSKIDFSNTTLKDNFVILWAGLQHEDKELTVEKVIELVDEYGNFSEVFGIMAQALSEAFGSKNA